MESRKYIGMDVHQASISAAVRDEAGKLVMECVIETNGGTKIAERASQEQHDDTI
jgi:hypothetical protein